MGSCNISLSLPIDWLKLRCARPVKANFHALSRHHSLDNPEHTFPTFYTRRQYKGHETLPKQSLQYYCPAAVSDPTAMRHDYTMTGNISGKVTVTYNGIMTSSVTMTTPDRGYPLPTIANAFWPPS